MSIVHFYRAIRGVRCQIFQLGVGNFQSINLEPIIVVEGRGGGEKTYYRIYIRSILKSMFICGIASISKTIGLAL